MKYVVALIALAFSLNSLASQSGAQQHKSSCELANDNSRAYSTADRAYLFGMCYEQLANYIPTDERNDKYVVNNLYGFLYRANFWAHMKNPAMKVFVGGVYVNGQHIEVPDAFSEIEQYFRTAAEAGNIDAQYQLAKILFIDDIEKMKVSKSMILAWNIAKEKSDFNDFMGTSPEYDIYNKFGLTNDEFKRRLKAINAVTDPNEITPEAAKWMRSAAEHGNVNAQFCMGAFAFFGIGRPINFVEAYAWYILAAARNPPFGSNRRDKYAQYLTDDEKGRGEGLSEDYIRRFSHLMDKPSLTIIH